MFRFISRFVTATIIMSGIAVIHYPQSSATPQKCFVDIASTSQPFINCPTSAVKIEETVGMKTATFKQSYSLGEFLLLDVVQLNKSDFRIYSPSIWSGNLKAATQNGKKVLVNTYSVPLRSNGFVLLERGKLEKRTLKLMLGCTEKLFNIIDGYRGTRSEIEIFEKDLFLNTGDACLDVEQGERIRLTIFLSNAEVVVEGIRSGTKTAVGSLHSNNIEIKIN